MKVGREDLKERHEKDGLEEELKYTLFVGRVMLGLVTDRDRQKKLKALGNRVKIMKTEFEAPLP